MIDAAFIIARALRAALPGSSIQLDRDATYDPSRTVTVVATPNVEPAGALPGRRLATAVTVVLTTTAAEFSDAADEAEAVADALLSATTIGTYQLSSITCDSGPVRLSPHDPSGAETVASTFRLFIRKR